MVIKTVNREIRQFVEEELGLIQELLMTKYNLNAQDSKQLIKEILAASIWGCGSAHLNDAKSFIPYVLKFKTRDLLMLLWWKFF